MATIQDAMGQITQLKRRWDAFKTEREHAEKLHHMARGTWGHCIRKWPHEPWWHADPRYRGRFAPNLLGMALKQLSYLYDEEPARTMDVGSEEDWADSRLWGFGNGLSVAMSSADTLARLHGVCLLYPVFKPTPDAARTLRAMVQDGQPLDDVVGRDVGAIGDQAGVEFVALPREHFEVLPNALDRRHAEAVVLWMGTRDVQDAGPDGSNVEGTKSVHVHHYWDREYFAVLHDFDPVALNKEGEKIVPHGMADHPLVTVRNTLDGVTFFGDPMGGHDLWENMLQVGALWREYGWAARLSRGQPYVIGKLEGFDGMAPDTVWQIGTPDGGGATGAGILQPANLNTLRQACLDHMEILAQTLNLPSRAFRLNERASMSGVAIALDRAELDDDRRTRIKLARGWERSVHRKAAMLWNAAKAATINGGMDVMFRPLPQMVTFEERLKRLQFLYANGLVSDEDVIKEMYPDLTQTQVDERLGRVADQRQKTEEQSQKNAEADAERQARINAASRPADPLAAILGEANPS